MNINLPQPGTVWQTWAAQIIIALRETFLKIQEPIPGSMILWAAASPIPAGYLEADGTEYPVSISPGLRRLYGESTPGNFEVPTVTAPTGSIVLVKT